MSIAERKGRQRAERESRIIAAARVIAEREGWDAVTIRRLADEIEHSQPVLYTHFDNRDAIVAAVAIEGFRELGDALHAAGRATNGRQPALAGVAMAYLDFALRCPALYEAMFVLPTNLRFAEAETRPELRTAFEALVAVVSPFADDVEMVTETFWAALHGLVELERSGRIRPGMRTERVALVVRALTGSADSSPDTQPRKASVRVKSSGPKP